MTCLAYHHNCREDYELGTESHAFCVQYAERWEEQVCVDLGDDDGDPSGGGSAGLGFRFDILCL